MFKELQRKESFSRSIVKALSEYVISNNLKPGDRLPTEKELAENFKVARTVVREAMRSMELIGLISSKPGVGSTLSAGGIDPFLIPFIFGVVFEDVTFNKLGELRLIMEQGAVRLAIKNASRNELLEFRKQAENLDKVKAKAYDDLSEENQNMLAQQEAAFHQNLVMLSHNPVLTKFSFLWQIFFTRAHMSQTFHKTSKAFKNKKVATALHVEIADAMLEKDEVKAMARVQDHLTYWLTLDQIVVRNKLMELVG